MSVTRLVVVTRASPLEQLVQRFGTYGQAQFHLKSRGESMLWYEQLHQRLERGLVIALAALPSSVNYVRVTRDQLDRFLFAPEDAVMIVGQDGLMANVAKYLSGQLAFGVNPDPEHYDGVLCPHTPMLSGALLTWCLAARLVSPTLDSAPDQATRQTTLAGRRHGKTSSTGQFRLEARVLAQALREDGQRLTALNEVFIGHRTHQSARYRLHVGGSEERQSSSGVIVATGTGSTGWARSMVVQRGITEKMPGPTEKRLAWFVREPWPSVASSTQLNFGFVSKDSTVKVISEMGEGGVIFADGVESDCIEFASGQSVEISIAQQRLNLVL
jgi:hypothetical protein